MTLVPLLRSFTLLAFVFSASVQVSVAKSSGSEKTSKKSSHSSGHSPRSKRGSRKSSSSSKSSKRYTARSGKEHSRRHYAASKGKGPRQEEITEEILPPGHKFTPEEKAEVSALGVLVENRMWKDALRFTTKATRAHPERWWLQAARAVAASNLNRPKDVIDAVDQAIRTNNGDANHVNLAELYTLKANALSAQNRKAEAINTFISAAQIAPKDAYSRAGAAWLYATAKDPSIRNGTSALALATEAANLTKQRDATVLDVLAAAYAEKGDYASAQRWEGKALLGANSDDAPYYQQRLQTYQAGKPWREQGK
jgi:tetratricopeptide (TPR) repeat protein